MIIKSNNHPFVSIVIPMRNEEKYIQKCIESFINQDYPQDRYEILVVDGCSNDNSVEIINKIVCLHKNIKIISNEKKITPIAFNIGIKNARGDYIIIFSSHGFAERNFISENIKLHLEKDVDCVGGMIITIGDNLQSKVISLAQSSIFGVGNSLFRISQKAQFVDTVAFGSYPKEIFNKIGNFDESLIRNQDFEFNHRIIKNGGKIYLSPTIKSSYYARSNIWKLVKQYFQYGYWKVQVLIKHFDSFRMRYLIPPIFMLMVIILGVMSLVYTVSTNLFFGLIFLYLSVILYASMTIAIKNKLLYFTILPSTFIALHFGFGLGFLSGIIMQIKEIVIAVLIKRPNK